ncbi:unnamed protein product [Amoebophrya sp. A25]|nr:unnamed protein product [Amoebophrya sp. A25]|eukprot:GSA25T00012718001.1
MTRRNALNILSKTLNVLPFTKEVGGKLLRLVRRIGSTDTRSDMKLLAQSLCNGLRKNEKGWKSREGVSVLEEARLLLAAQAQKAEEERLLEEKRLLEEEAERQRLLEEEQEAERKRLQALAEEELAAQKGSPEDAAEGSEDKEGSKNRPPLTTPRAGGRGGNNKDGNASKDAPDLLDQEHRGIDSPEDDSDAILPADDEEVAFISRPRRKSRRSTGEDGARGDGRKRPADSAESSASQGSNSKKTKTGS